ncbi:MAG TPA: TolC family protein [bacterium]|nr:TolC family protein [bacterium]
MKARILLILIINFISLQILANDYGKKIDIPLDWLINHLEKNNVQILNQRNNLEYTKYQIDETKAAARPYLGLEASYMRQKLAGVRNSSSFDNYNYAINLAQPLFTYGKISTAIKIAQDYYQLSESDYSKTIKDITLAAAEIMYSIKMLEYRIKILQSTQKTFAEHFKITELRYKIGDAAQVDYLSARVNYEQIAPIITELENKISNLKNELKLLLNLELDIDLIVKEDIIRDTSITIDKKNVIDSALKNNDDLKKLKENYEITLLQKKIAENTLRPELNFIASYGGTSDDINNILKKDKENALIGVKLNFPIFDGFRSKNQVSQYSIKLQNLERTLKQYKDSIVKEATNIINDLEFYKKQIAANETLVSAAQEAFRIAQENYNAGAAVSLNVIESEKDKLNAQLKLLESKYNFILTHLKLKQISGLKLTDNF